MHKLLMKVAVMHLKVIFRRSDCIEVYGKLIGTVTPAKVSCRENSASKEQANQTHCCMAGLDLTLTSS